MSNLQNCPQCGKIFAQTSFKRVCDNCAREEEKQLDTVMVFVRKKANRQATIDEVVVATGVEKQHIYRWIQQGRLRTTGLDNLGYPCTKCKQLIKSGTLCESCQGGLKKQIDQLERQKAVTKQENKPKTYLSSKLLQNNADNSK